LSMPYRVLAYGIIMSELLTALMTFSKLEVLTVVLMVILGLYLRRPRMRILVLGVTLLCALYIILAPFVLFAREAFDPRGVSKIGDFATSAHAYRGLDAHDLASLLGGAQIWWTRLSYANAQTFAMQAFDVGEPGDSFAMAAYASLPRVLYPDKPIIAIGDKYHGTDDRQGNRHIYGRGHIWGSVLEWGMDVGPWNRVFCRDVPCRNRGVCHACHGRPAIGLPSDCVHRNHDGTQAR